MNKNNNKISVLIADDHPMVRDGLVSCLAYYDDIQIIGEAKNGEQAIALSIELKPDVVLMDVSMPLMNGIDATEILVEQTPNIKILAFSMHDNPEFVSSVIEAGASGYILKDVKSDEVYYAIKAVNDGRTYFSSTVAKNLLENPSKGLTERLTSREQSVLSLVSNGMSNKQISSQLNISVRTVEAHRRNIKTKLEIDSLAELIKYAIDHGLSQSQPS